MEFIDYTSKVSALLSKINRDEIFSLIEIIRHAVKNNQNIFIAGNGGSAAIASHFVTDLSRYQDKTTKHMCRASSLVDNVPLITAIANDFGYEEVFAKQIQRIANPSDIVIAISSSGNSSNVNNLIKHAKDLGLITIGMYGFDGGELKKHCEYGIHVTSEIGEYEITEDCHSILCHFIARVLKS